MVILIPIILPQIAGQVRRMRRFGALFFLFFISGILSIPASSQAPGSQPETLSAGALITRGEAYQRSGDFEKAFAVFTEALAASRKTRTPGEEATCLLKSGITSWDLGNISDAGGFFEEALSLAKKRKNVLDERFCESATGIVHFYNLGKEYRSKNQNQKSLESFDRALALGEETGIEDFALKCLRQKSLTYWQIGDFQAFYACANHGLEISKKINHRKEMGRCLNNLGAYYERMSDYSSALRYLEEAEAESKKAGDQETQAESSSNIGGIYLELDNLTQAENHYRNALIIDRILGKDLNLVLDLNHLGIVLTKRARTYHEPDGLNAALQCFYDGRRLLLNRNEKRELIQTLNNIAYTYYLKGNFEQAARNFKLCLTEVSGVNYAEAACAINLNLGNLNLARYASDSAIIYFNNAIKAAAASNLQEILWEAYFGLGQCYEEKKELITALSYYKRSIEIIEKIRSHITLDMFKISFTRDKLVVYQRALDVLYSIYSANPSNAVIEDLFQIMERAKARSFVESLIEARVNFEESLNPRFVEREKEISREISGISRQLSDPRLAGPEKEKRSQELELKEEEYLKLISEVRTENRDVAGMLFPPISSLPQVQMNLLSEHASLLEYFIGDKDSFLFHISPQKTKLYKLPGRSILEDSLRAYLKILSSPSPGAFEGIRAAERIAGELVFPLMEDPNPAIDTLIIIPDGVLHYLPFETLRIRKDGKVSYLVEQYNVSYGPSSTSLVLLEEKPRRHKSGKSLLAFGDPIERKGRSLEEPPGSASAGFPGEIASGDNLIYPGLPYSRQEVLSIARLFASQNKAVFIGDTATESTLKKRAIEKYEVIHFACHGLFDEKYPFRSALVLSPDQNQEDDGFLQVREIYGLRMNAGLVVLSACHSGNGTLEKGEGLLGLTRTFFYAGARAVLSSIWSVNDRSTAVFMEDFYKGLVRGEDKISALRTAKLNMLRTARSHPYYWAGFVLNGDPSALWVNEKAGRRAN